MSGLKPVDVPSKKILITGGTDGIGREAALQLASLGHQVSIAGRSEARARQVQQHASQAGWPVIEFLAVDLADFASTATFAHQVADGCFDVVVLNAAVMMPAKATTIDGLDTTFQVNLLSNVLIVEELLNQRHENGLKIVIVSSIIYRAARIRAKGWFRLWDAQRTSEWKAAMTPGTTSDFGRYTSTKFGLVTLSAHVNAQRRDDVSAVAMHPGSAGTSLSTTIPTFWRTILYPLKYFLVTTKTCGEAVVNAVESPSPPPNTMYMEKKLAPIGARAASDATVDAMMHFCGDVIRRLRSQQ